MSRARSGPYPVTVTDQEDDRSRQQVILTVVLKFVGVAIVVCVGIGVATHIVVNSLGLKDTRISGLGPAPVEPITPLPTTALPVPTQLPSQPTPTGIFTGTPTDVPSGDLALSASPVMVKPMERINLTGSWAGHDAMGLMVQRFENGRWVDFGIQTQVNVGTFGTYVQTGHVGDNKFRVIDPNTGTTSNEVTVTVG